jgi:hypothetical protein
MTLTMPSSEAKETYCRCQKRPTIVSKERENRNDSDDAVFRARDERILVNHNHLSLNLAPPKH